MGTTNHYRAFPLPIGTLTAVGKTADLVARITVAVVFAETAFDSIGDFVSTEPVDTSGSLRCVFVAIQVAGAALLVKPSRFGWFALLLLPLTILTLLAQAISPPVRDFPMHRRSPSSARCPGSVAWRSVAFSVSKALEFPPASLTDRPGVFLRSKILAYFADFLLYLLLSGCSIVSVLLSAAPNILYWRSHRLSGISAWTLIEYPVHKYVLQLALLLPARHATHYDAPTGLIKTPTLGEPSPDVGHLRCSGWSSTEHKGWSSGRRSCDLPSSAPRRTPCRPWFIRGPPLRGVRSLRRVTIWRLHILFGTKSSERRRPSSGLAMR